MMRPADHCPSRAWDDYVRDMEKQHEFEVETFEVCEIHGEEYPVSHGCASCMADELAREAKLAEEAKDLTDEWLLERIATLSADGIFHNDTDFWGA